MITIPNKCKLCVDCKKGRWIYECSKNECETISRNSLLNLKEINPLPKMFK